MILLCSFQRSKKLITDRNQVAAKMTARALVAAAAAQIYPSYSPGGAEYTPNAILIGIHLFLLGLQS